MEPNLQKQEFSIAYVHAVCATAGFAMQPTRVDNDSIDVKISADRTFHRSAPGLDLQLKCTADFKLRETEFSFRLPIKNYDDLRDPIVWTPRLLVVVCVPDPCGQWLQQTEEAALLKHCGYWLSLRGAPNPEDSEQEKITVHIQRNNIFSVEALTRIMHTIGMRGSL
ncbi:DUF4365 domain-containing protein [Archangium sp.]|jgi:hypothetical protein|uniref:DUF4365 domain-containing protein n=1 Tax=Archangium sp. TaxID=1872627 RepID=UPI002ED8FF44